jgi:hypothetical protein
MRMMMRVPPAPPIPGPSSANCAAEGRTPPSRPIVTPREAPRDPRPIVIHGAERGIYLPVRVARAAPRSRHQERPEGGSWLYERAQPSATPTSPRVFWGRWAGGAGPEGARGSRQTRLRRFVAEAS